MRLASISLLLAAASVAAVSGCSSAESPPARAPAPPVAASHATAPVASRPRLVFFMNPAGRPCQVQDDILRRMADLPARADVVYYRTTNPNDLGWFSQFGVRSLPALVVTDASGRELRRATPGIQSEAQVRALLGY